MGAVFSYVVPDVPRQSAPPDMLLLSPGALGWTELSKLPTAVVAEALACAFHLHAQSNAWLSASDDFENSGLHLWREAGRYVGVDCEMVGVGPDGEESVLGRVSLVDFHGGLVYDSYVRPELVVTDWRTAVSGIAPHHMKHARGFDEVQKAVSGIIKDRILVGHDLRHDLAVLKVTHPGAQIRDTSSLAEFKRRYSGNKPSLKRLAQDLLGLSIQQQSHSSIVDARVAMLLFGKYKAYFDVDHASRYEDKNITQARTDEKGNACRRKKKR